jgi:hypothetical protein
MSKAPPRYPPDWVDRQVIPDVYPRRDDPFRPLDILPAPYGTPEGGTSIPVSISQDILNNAITMPSVRPVVYQRAFNLSLTVTDQPVAIQPGTFQCDAIMVDVVSTSVNSTFFGYGSGVTTASGIEVRPGLPQFFSPDNTREQWEIQRLLESITAYFAFFIQMQTGSNVPTPGKYLAPRVVMNAHDYYLVNATGITQTVAVMLFTVPEYQ